MKTITKNILKYTLTAVFSGIIAGIVIYSLDNITFHRNKLWKLSSYAAVAGEKKLTEDEKINIKIYKEYSPAVVNITTTTLKYDFFYAVTPESGSGSGVIIDPQGYILTNNHVIERANNLTVTLNDGTEYPAELAGTDATSDIAIIKITPPQDIRLKYIPIGNSDSLEVGQRVFAIGNPFGFQSTLTTGVISNIGRTLKSDNNRVIMNVIQTDAAINPGNSGGPLIDTQGTLIGLNTAIFSPSRANAGIGFAIPASTVRHVVPDLINFGYVKKPFLGIKYILPVNKPLAKLLKLPENDGGILIQQIIQGSPADKSGLIGGDRLVTIGRYNILFGGDVIYTVDGNRFDDPVIFASYIESKKAGDVLKFGVFRQNRYIEINVKLEEAQK
jgi:S1-C subfamily serine protease